MKAIITAAGMGERLGALTKDTSKCLLAIGGKPLLRRLVDTLTGFGIVDIALITGHCAQKIEDEFGKEVTYFLNKYYATTGILASVVLAKEFVGRDDFLFFAGDSMIYPDIIKKFLETPGQVLASIEKKKCDAEDLKAVVKNGNIIEMSKKMDVERADGEFTGMIKVSQDAAQAFFEEAEAFIKNGSQKKYVADAVLLLQKKGFDVVPVYTNGLPRIEIDTPEDYARAQKLFATEFIS